MHHGEALHWHAPQAEASQCIQRLQEKLLSQQGMPIRDGLLCDNEALLEVTATTIVLQQPGTANYQLQSSDLIHHASPTVLCVMHHL